MKLEKIFEDETKKKMVLEIIEKLNGESYDDCKEIIDAVNFMLKAYSFLDVDLARDVIEVDE